MFQIIQGKLPILLILICLSGRFLIAQTNNHWENIEEWHKTRTDALLDPEGWLSVVGLHWLKEGKPLSVGSGEKVDIKLPKLEDDTLGWFVRENNEVVFHPVGNTFLADDEKIMDPVVINSDATNYTRLTKGSYLLYVIKRQDEYGIRIKDSLSERRTEFKAIPRFPVSEEWVFQAKVIWPTDADTVTYDNMVGMRFHRPVKAFLEFEYNDKPYRLTALEGGSDVFFVILADETTGLTTYGGGRYLYPKIPDGGMTFIDFNQAINPPCVFTDFATCPLPPKENYLPFPINAGEKDIKK